MPHQRDWIDYLLAFAPFLAICVAVSVALMQAYLQRQSLKQHLFEKRFEVYKAVREYMEFVVHSNGCLDLTLYDSFKSQTAPAKFLFGADVQFIIDDIKKHVTLADNEYEELETQRLIDPTVAPT
jgi:hypothetical protein